MKRQALYCSLSAAYWRIPSLAAAKERIYDDFWIPHPAKYSPRDVHRNHGAHVGNIVLRHCSTGLG